VARGAPHGACVCVVAWLCAAGIVLRAPSAVASVHVIVLVGAVGKTLAAFLVAEAVLSRSSSTNGRLGVSEPVGLLKFRCVCVASRLLMTHRRHGRRRV
jgi:hypothetical protein